MARATPKRVVITGASSGIGAALARHYAEQHAILGLIARRESALRALVEKLPCKCIVYALDVRDGPALHRAAADFVSRYGCPDIVIANAGVSTGTLTEHAEDLQAFQTVIDVNVIGMSKTFQPFVAAMREGRKGTLAGIASVAGYRGLPGSAAYAASKAAVISYLESLRIEMRGTGVNVVTICPGFVLTPLTAENPYRMPFAISADCAARKIISIIERGTVFAVIPWQMALVARLLHVMPRWLYDRLLKGAPRKPRRPT